MSKITAMYIRLSMEDEDVSLNQKEESNSVSSQRELLEAFIGNHSELKDTKVQEYCDDGFTGTKFERPGYMKLQEQFDKSAKVINEKINAWYQRYADNNNMSLLEARKSLNDKELKELKWDVEEYIKKGRENAFSGEWVKELENASAKAHISRLEALELQCRQQAEWMEKYSR